MSRGDQLIVQELSKLSASPFEADLSPLGSAALSLSQHALSLASGGLTKNELLAIGVDAATEVMTLAQPMLQELAADVATEAASQGLQGVAEAIPIVAQAVQLIAGVAGLFQSLSEAHDKQAAAFCQAQYVPLPTAPWGSGIGGEVRPADLFWGAAAGVHAGLTPTAIKILVQAESLADPATTKAAKNAALGLNVFGDITGVPKSVLAQLKSMRKAMHDAHNDSADGGKSLFLVYVDLWLTQLRNHKTSLKYMAAQWDAAVDVGCGTILNWQPREELRGLFHAWDTTAFPVYEVDKIALAGLIKKVTEPKIYIHGIANIPTHKVSMHRLTLSSATTKALLAAKTASKNHGVIFNAVPAGIGPALVKRPSRSIPHPSGDEIIRLIIEACHGNTHEHTQAQAEVAEGIAEILPEETEALAMARTLVLQTEAGDVCSADAMAQIADDAEQGDEQAIETLGYIVAVVDGLEDGSVPPMTEEEAVEYASGCLEDCDCENGSDENPVFSDEDIDAYNALAFGIVGAGSNPRSVIIWKQGVPSGIKQSHETTAIRKGFDPQPDPPGFQMKGANPVDPNAGGFIIYGKQGSVNGDYPFGHIDNPGLGYAEGAKIIGDNDKYPYDGSTYGWDDFYFDSKG